MTAEHRHQLALESSPAAAGEASVWVRTLGAQHSLAKPWIEGFDLCVAELTANITDHAYSGGPGEIRLQFEISSKWAELTVEDDGPAFDPLDRAAPKQPASLEDAPIGGLGIHLVRQTAEHCRYERLDQSNRMTVGFGDATKFARRADRRINASGEFPVTRADMHSVAQDQRLGVDRRALGFISRTDLFRGVPYDLLESVLADCRITAHKDGDLILAAGTASQRVWVIVEGRLRVHLDDPGSADYVEILCGECVGEISVADGKLSSAWVVAAGDCRLLEIDATIFLDRLLTIPQVGRNLVSILAERMRVSNQRISEKVRLETELKALQRELDFARRIQSSMLPANPLFGDDPRLDCHGFMRAARQVGGDFFDALQLDSDRYLVSIGDVCNKGLPAALFMAQTLALLRSAANQERNDETDQLAVLVSHGNNQLCHLNTEELFVSLFLAVIDLGKDEMRYVNAGHNPPLLIYAGQAPQFVDLPRNPVAGLVQDIQYRAGSVSFPAGSTLLLYTDGITEAETAEQRQFGDEALIACVANATDSAANLVNLVVARVDEFAAGYTQADDITLLALRRK